MDDAVQRASKTNLSWLVMARASSIVVYNNQGLSRFVGKRLTRRGSIPAWSIRSSSWRTQSFPDTDQVLGRIILVDERVGLSGRIMGSEFLPEIRPRWTRETRSTARIPGIIYRVGLPRFLTSLIKTWCSWCYENERNLLDILDMAKI